MRSFTIVVLISLAAVAIVVTYFLVEPAPPKEIRIAAGSRSGAYYPIAQRLAQKMRPHGVRVEILETKANRVHCAMTRRTDRVAAVQRQLLAQ